MEVLYRSTRGNGSTVTASNAILKGLSEDGGLFVPDQIPVLDVPVEQLAQMSYQEVAYEVMSRFLTDFTEEELKKFYKEQKESTTIRKPKKIGRNDPCPCGSGKKYKQCCGRFAE